MRKHPPTPFLGPMVKDLHANLMGCLQPMGQSYHALGCVSRSNAQRVCRRAAAQGAIHQDHLVLQGHCVSHQRLTYRPAHPRRPRKGALGKAERRRSHHPPHDGIGLLELGKRRPPASSVHGSHPLRSTDAAWSARADRPRPRRDDEHGSTVSIASAALGARRRAGADPGLRAGLWGPPWHAASHATPPASSLIRVASRKQDGYCGGVALSRGVYSC